MTPRVKSIFQNHFYSAISLVNVYRVTSCMPYYFVKWDLSGSGNAMIRQPQFETKKMDSIRYATPPWLLCLCSDSSEVLDFVVRTVITTVDARRYGRTYRCHLWTAETGHRFDHIYKWVYRTINCNTRCQCPDCCYCLKTKDWSAHIVTFFALYFHLASPTICSMQLL